MASITLGTLKTYWQNVSQWVMGTNSATPAITITGQEAVVAESVQGSTVLAGATKVLTSPDIDGTKYKETSVFVIWDQDLDFAVYSQRRTTFGGLLVDRTEFLGEDRSYMTNEILSGEHRWYIVSYDSADRILDYEVMAEKR